MKHEGTARQHFFKWGKFLDDECYGIIASDWKGMAFAVGGAGL
jgi:RimJ/RimL family protein N-acetyltransferase